MSGGQEALGGCHARAVVWELRRGGMATTPWSSHGSGRQAMGPLMTQSSSEFHTDYYPALRQTAMSH